MKMKSRCLVVKDHIQGYKLHCKFIKINYRWLVVKTHIQGNKLYCKFIKKIKGRCLVVKKSHSGQLIRLQIHKKSNIEA